MADSVQETRLKNYIDAEQKALLSQEYQEGGKKNRRADLNQISEGINELLAGGAGATYKPGGRSRRVILRDL
ncbi:hypothetical protein SPSIL_008950 [Sporomusa silvacetica DSM 10669]|uniref:Uncharacterized protein n=1 Tax=Sporomusa silvacetica DSM 10669 TaxID=1123289 RepID=A0ABZ3IGJ6_9FIRM|nr:hypothetical protein [Sporomusa silvacetica]OZC13145.1 hypothetical protein SPSIL_56010 [Sporomusa silvacetica DSM 10669]